jgi:hypothetical protein
MENEVKTTKSKVVTKPRVAKQVKTTKTIMEEKHV